MQHLIVFVQTLAEAQTRDLDFVRKDLSVKNPLGLLVRLPNNVVLFKQANASVSVRGGKVEPVFADDQMFDRGGLFLADFQRLGQLFVLARSRLHHLNLPVALTYKQFSAVGRELHGSKDFVDVSFFFFAAARALLASC